MPAVTTEMLTQAQATIDEMTDKPWFSWKAHIDTQRNAVYWGSDFVCELRFPEDFEALPSKIQDYIDNRMREKTW